ncbi:RusA family crossover junction endodeoxyribonuclease [Hyphomicrobium sp. B1]|uniref:RusA family crossover junction endodeoxyribonuclease n=1 Tax=Hyphomicrobium sp. B1 TaxID=3075651 RepID=UPI003C2C3B54
METDLPFRLTLPLPPSANALFANIRGHGRVRTYAYRKWSDVAGWTIRVERPRKFLGPVSIEIRAGIPRRRRDLDNLAKPVIDALVSFDVIVDDSDQIVRAVTLAWDSNVEPEKILLVVRAA